MKLGLVFSSLRVSDHIFLSLLSLSLSFEPPTQLSHEGLQPCHAMPVPHPPPSQKSHASHVCVVGRAFCFKSSYAMVVQNVYASFSSPSVQQVRINCPSPPLPKF